MSKGFAVVRELLYLKSNEIHLSFLVFLALPNQLGQAELELQQQADEAILDLCAHFHSQVFPKKNRSSKMKIFYYDNIITS